MARLTEENVRLAQEIISRYPRPRSATIPLLHLAQEQDGHVTEEAMAHIAELVGASPAEVYGTASFYEMFKFHPVGKYVINICGTMSCALMGAEDLMHHAEEKLGVRMGGIDMPVSSLSGGNQQKVVLGKWLALRPNVLLLDEPTRGIDVGAKQEIYQLMDELAQQGLAVLFVSSELEEILGMSDRVLVMHEGRVTGQLQRDQLSEQAIMKLATGFFAEQAVP